jgi:hypothetical protein
MKPGIVYYKTDKKRKVLKYLDHNFKSIASAVIFIRHQYSIYGLNYIKLKIKTDYGILFWDNY